MIGETRWAGRVAWCGLAIFIIYGLYFHGLTSVGLIGPDEPRYASIGREMARSGDWVTPRLWGEAWFEKPALLYWMVGAAFRLGLSEDLAPRLPIAALSVAFLSFYWWRLRVEFGAKAAGLATVMLATTAGWLGFSFVAVTDLPLAASYSAALLLSLAWIRNGDRRTACMVGALLGVSVLAKGLVPLVLFAPVAWFSRKLWRQWAWVAAGCLVVAGPWYLLCTLRNGRPFLAEFFLKHQFGRFTQDTLKHEQRVWFYLPALAAGLFPWTPVAVLLGSHKVFADQRRGLLAASVLFGLVFFSTSVNKLPGYLLPLLPACCALMAARVEESARRGWALAASVVLLGLVPMAVTILPMALEVGLRRSVVPAVLLAWLIPAAALAWVTRGRGEWAAVAVVALGMTAGVLQFKLYGAARFDEKVSARPLGREVKARPGQVCVESLHRALRYGLNYYTFAPVPDCEQAPRPLRISQQPGRRPELRAEATSSSPTSASGSSR